MRCEKPFTTSWHAKANLVFFFFIRNLSLSRVKSRFPANFGVKQRKPKCNEETHLRGYSSVYFLQLYSALEQTHLHIITCMFYSHLASHLKSLVPLPLRVCDKTRRLITFSWICFSPPPLSFFLIVSLILKGYLKSYLIYPRVPCARCSIFVLGSSETRE